jgi:putative transposase
LQSKDLQFVGVDWCLQYTAPLGIIFLVGKYPQQYKSNANVVYSCKYHVVWTPKYRRKVLTAEVATRLSGIIRESCSEMRCEILALEVMPDHVHLLLEVDPQFGIHRAIKLIKGRSSRSLRLEFPHLKSRLPTLWTNAYFVSTVGGAPLSVIKQYVENQKDV